MTVLRVLDLDGVEHEVEARADLKVMENLQELDFGVTALCGGMCSCATCHIYVDADWSGNCRRPCRTSASFSLISRIASRSDRDSPVRSNSPPSSPSDDRARRIRDRALV